MSAAEMREAAAKEAESATYAKVSLCCNGRECGCQGASVGEYVAHLIRALPLPDEEGMVEVLRELLWAAEQPDNGDQCERYQKAITAARAAIRAINGGNP